MTHHAASAFNLRTGKQEAIQVFLQMNIPTRPRSCGIWYPAYFQRQKLRSSIADKRRAKYLSGLRTWDEDPDELLDLAYDEQCRFAETVEIHRLEEHGSNFLTPKILQRMDSFR